MLNLVERSCDFFAAQLRKVAEPFRPPTLLRIRACALEALRCQAELGFAVAQPPLQTLHQPGEHCLARLDRRNLLLDRFLRLLERIDERKRIRRRIGEGTPIVGARLGVTARLHDVRLALLRVESLRERAFELMQQTHSIADLGVGCPRRTTFDDGVGAFEAHKRRTNIAKPRS